MTDVGLPNLISRYAGQLGSSGDHAVVSPVGLWLLVALIAPAATGGTRRDLEVVLGTTVDDAAARARALLAEPHPAVSALAAVWDRDLGPAFDRWAATLPGTVERGPVPTRAAADAWARHRTRDVITEFPLDITASTRLLLASAVAADIAWVRPLGTSTELGGDFGTRIERALVVDGGIQLVADTAAGGLVAVCAPESSSALDVLSVIAAPEVPADRVHRAAHQVAAMLRGDRRDARPVPPGELGDGHAWTVTERRVRRFGSFAEEIVWRSHLPAWSASSSHDLDRAPGMSAVFRALAEFARPEHQPVEFAAKQSAVASLTREGFRAAAVTAIDMRVGSARQMREVLVRSITARFNRPHAVLACAAGDSGPAAWRGLPVFSAWVTQPDDTPEEPEPPAARVAAPRTPPDTSSRWEGAARVPRPVPVTKTAQGRGPGVDRRGR